MNEGVFFDLPRKLESILMQSGICSALSQATDPEEERIILRDVKSSLDVTLELWHDLCVYDVGNGEALICVYEVVLMLQLESRKEMHACIEITRPTNYACHIC
jgi:hypothetical protein